MLFCHLLTWRITVGTADKRYNSAQSPLQTTSAATKRLKHLHRLPNATTTLVNLNPLLRGYWTWNWMIMSTKEIRIFIAAAVHNVIHLTLNRLCSSKYKLHKYQQGCMPCPEKCILFSNIYRKNQLCVRLRFKQRVIIRLQKWISDSFSLKVVKAC